MVTELRIGQLQQVVERGHAVERAEFHVVIVIASLQPGLLRNLAQLVQLLGVPLPVIQRDVLARALDGACSRAATGRRR